jgi:predicted acylesterase/phospholipase RssA
VVSDATTQKVDIALSSGFLAFSRHIGFLRAIESDAVQVTGVCGTSSGALVGALWAAGLTTQKIQEIVTAQRPSRLLCPTPRVWRGAMSLRGLLKLLRDNLPSTFSELPLPLAVGVCDPKGNYRLLDTGSLPEAVAASCAIPVAFEPVEIDGTLYSDGGAKERLGLDAWRALRPHNPIIAHLVERTAGAPDTSLKGATMVVRSERSGASFFSLGDVSSQISETQERTRLALAQLRAE